MYVRLKDIAERAGVSVNAVSLALRDAPDIGEDTARKIKQLADEMGYVTNELHQFTFNRKSKIVGIVIASVTNPYYYIFLSEIINALAGTDYSPLIIKCGDNVMSDENLKSFMRKRVGGIISLVHVESGVIEKCNRYKIPLITAGIAPDNAQINAFYWDNGLCGRLVGQEFVNSGRKRPCYISYASINANTERRRGFTDYLKERGFSCGEISVSGNFITDNFSEYTSKIIENRYDFIFCFNDESAAIVKNSLIGSGYTDFDIYGVDGITKYFPSVGAINSISADYVSVSKMAVDRLFELIELGDTAGDEFSTVVCPVSVLKY